jgi:hypothetical protein
LAAASSLGCQAGLLLLLLLLDVAAALVEA